MAQVKKITKGQAKWALVKVILEGPDRINGDGQLFRFATGSYGPGIPTAPVCVVGNMIWKENHQEDPKWRDANYYALWDGDQIDEFPEAFQEHFTDEALQFLIEVQRAADDRQDWRTALEFALEVEEAGHVAYDR